MIHFDVNLNEQGNVVLVNYISKEGYWLQFNGVNSMESLGIYLKIR